MKTFIYCLFISLICTGTFNAQVKIGNNPNSINANSILELESTNKGFLPPRVALIHTDSISPLAVGTPAGMRVYSSGGTIADGHYSWTGSKWQLFNTTTKSNYVLIKSASDFPAPVSGVITLSANTLYEVNGTVNLTSKINLNGATIIGQNIVYDQLVYTPSSGALFTGALGGNIKNITITASNPGSKVFDLDAANAMATALLLESVNISNSDNIGLVKGFGAAVVFNTVTFVNNTNGITLENIGDYIEINNFWIAGNQNTFQTFVGTFTTILISGGLRQALSVFSAKCMNVTGITAIATGAELKNTLFSGDGVKVVGSFSKQWEVESTGVDTEKDAVATGNLYISSAATTIISSTGVPVKVSGTTTAASLFRVTSPVSNRLTYAGTKARRFQVICSLTATQPSSNKYFSFYIAKNGVILPESRQEVKILSNTDQGPLTLSCTVSLALNDYLEVWVENETSSTDITVQTMNFAIK